MGFSTPAQQEQFLIDAPDFEQMLTASGIRLIKFWLDVSKTEQRKRLEERLTDPLKRLKTGPMDKQAQIRWDAYTLARDEMLVRTHTAVAPWTCVRADHKKRAHINIMRHLLHALAAPKPAKRVDLPDPRVVSPSRPKRLGMGGWSVEPLTYGIRKPRLAVFPVIAACAGVEVVVPGHALVIILAPVGDLETGVRRHAGGHRVELG